MKKGIKVQRKKVNAGSLLPRLQLRGRDSAEVLSVLKIDWPVAGSVLEKLVAFIGVSSQAGSDTHGHVQEIVERALNAYSDALYVDDRTKHPDPVRISVFLNVVMTETCRALRVELADAAGKIWNPEDGTSLAQWGEESNTPVHSMEGGPSDKAVRRALYDLLASDELKIVLRKSNHEKAILDGRLALCDRAGHRHATNSR